MLKIYSYILVRDYGFAPNPFYGYCTLATCKPLIRNPAKINQWVVGVGSNEVKSSMKGKLIYAMKITEKMTFNDYWNDIRYRQKKVVLNGSYKQFFGDNIYHFENGEWIQENSHHSHPNGEINRENLETDTSSKFVLISNDYYYLGKNAIDIPDNLSIMYKDIGIGHISDKIPMEIRKAFVSWLRDEINPKPGINGDPLLFEQLDRYTGN